MITMAKCASTEIWYLTPGNTPREGASISEECKQLSVTVAIARKAEGVWVKIT